MLVTIIMPIRNEVKFIAKSIDSFLAQMKGRDDVEILCVDGMSTDGTSGIIRQYAERDKRVRLIENPAKITPVAMNLAIKEARGDFVMVVGCHAKYAPNYVDSCLEVIQRTDADQAGGYMTTIAGEDTPTGQAIAAATSCKFGVGNSYFRLSGGERYVDTVPFGIFRREVFEKVGLYDERLVRNQDIEMSSRIRKSGGRIIISPEIKLNYYNRSTYIGIWQQSFNNGLWNPYTVWLVGGGLCLRHFIPMAFVLSLILFAVGSCFFWSIRILLAVDMLLYFSIAAFFARSIAKKSDVSGLKVFWAFTVLHIAYGIGSLWGFITILFKFPNRNKGGAGKALANRKI